MAKRVRIATYGRRGQLVRVFSEVSGGKRLVRVQWNETPGAPLSTESWPKTKTNVKTAKAFAEGTSQRLAAGMAAPMADRTLRELADLHIAAFVESWAAATLRNFRHRWGRFEAFVGRSTSAKLITEETLDEFRAKMRTTGVATNQRGETVKHVRGSRRPPPLTQSAPTMADRIYQRMEPVRLALGLFELAIKESHGIEWTAEYEEAQAAAFRALTDVCVSPSTPSAP